MSALLIKQCCAMARALKVNFTLKDSVIPYENVFSVTGLMPALAKRADQLCSLCLGYGLGVSFEDEKSSTLGTKVKFDEVTPNSLRLMCILDVVCELVHLGGSRDRTPVDELMFD